MRKILLFIAILLIVGAGVWYFLIRPKTSNTPGGLGTFFPSTESGTVPEGDEEGGGVNTTTGGVSAVNSPDSKLTQITGRAIAGYTVFSISRKISIPASDPKQKPTIQTIVDHYIRYVSRANGYVYEIKNDESPLQISNISIPNIYEASFADNNKTAILRFLRDDNHTIATYSVPIPEENPDGTRTQIAGAYSPDDTLALSISPDTKQVGKVILAQNGTSIQMTSSMGVGQKELLRSPFHEWLINWPTQKTIYLQTKAASTAEGFLYGVDITSPKLRRILGNINGLTTSVSPSGMYVLYSESGGDTFTTKIFNTKTNTITPLSLKILPEKCIWDSQENLYCAGNNSIGSSVYPDAWYAGLVHFSDELYSINTKDTTYQVLYDGREGSLDMVNLSIDEDLGKLYFMDKQTGSLWMYTY